MAGSKRDEQEQEIDCLLSMFPEELNVSQKKPHFIFDITLRNISDEERDCEVSVTVQFKLGTNYPDEAPEIEVTENESLTDDEISGIIDSCSQVCQDNLGMPMVFTVIMQIQELLAVAMQRVVSEARDASERVKIERELAEKKRFHGTPVTVENFLVWKRKYDAEMAAIKQTKIKNEIKTPLKPTGKELFQRDESLVDATGIADDDEIIDSEDSEADGDELQPDLGLGDE